MCFNRNQIINILKLTFPEHDFLPLPHQDFQIMARVNEKTFNIMDNVGMFLLHYHAFGDVELNGLLGKVKFYINTIENPILIEGSSSVSFSFCS